MTDARDALAALIGEHLPVTDHQPYDEVTEPGEVFIEGLADLRKAADAILAAGTWLPHIPESQIVHLELDDE